MKIKSPVSVRLIGAVAAALMLGGAADAPIPKRNWNTVVARTANDSHLLGNPAAKLKLTEFVSYTCSHCAEFEAEAEAPLRLTMIARGQGSVEVRNFVRDPVDMTVALLAHCGGPSKFFVQHGMFLRSQKAWIEPLSRPSPHQRARWFEGSFASRTKAIATDFKFYEIMKTRGYTREQVNVCLSNEALANRLAAQTAAAAEAGVEGTPSFQINGTLLAGTHDWATLRPQLDARID